MPPFTATRLAVALLAALAALAAPGLCSAAPRAVQAHEIIWCEKIDQDATDPRVQERYNQAEAKLCAGNYAAAANDLIAIQSAFIPDAAKQLDFQRRFIIATSLGGRSDDAFRLLQKLAPLDAKDPARDFFAGRDCAAIRGYLAGDSKILMTPDQRDDYKGPPAAFTAAAEKECAGDTDGAIAAIRPIAASNALYALVMGDLYAQKRDWKSAGAAWWEAAGEYPEIPMMEWANFDTYCPPALLMLWYYRAHLPR